MKNLSHGTHTKTVFVAHETVSYNVPGLADILGVETTLQHKGYGIHGMTDKDGYKAWANGMGEAIFWHCGNANPYATGVENVSEIPLLVQTKKITHKQAYEMWMQRHQQLSALAILMACWHNVHPVQRPLRRTDGKPGSRGVCSHWDLSQWDPGAEGHWDCWPEDKGGYFPLDHVIYLAKHYASSYRF